MGCQPKPRNIQLVAYILTSCYTTLTRQSSDTNTMIIISWCHCQAVCGHFYTFLVMMQQICWQRRSSSSPPKRAIRLFINRSRFITVNNKHRCHQHAAASSTLVTCLHDTGNSTSCRRPAVSNVTYTRSLGDIVGETRCVPCGPDGRQGKLRSRPS